MCVCLVAHSCLILCDSMDYSLPGSTVHGISQARVLEWVAICSSRESSWTRNGTCISYVSCIGRRILYHCASWEACPKSFSLPGIESRPLAQDGTSPGSHPAPDLPLSQLRLNWGSLSSAPWLPTPPAFTPTQMLIPKGMTNKILSTAKMGCSCLMGTEFQFKKMKQFWSSGDGRTIMWMHLITLNWIYN